MIQSQFKLKGTPSSALLGATLGFFFGVMAISLFGPTSTTLGAAMGLGATELGLLVSVPSLTGSLLRIPFGAMVDSNGGRRGFLFLLAAAVVGLGALSLLFTLYPVETPGSMRDLYPVVLLLGCLAGCGIATFSVGASQSNYWFVKSRQGYASGIYGGLGTTSAGILAFALPLLLHHFGFTAAYYILTGVMLLGLLLYIWLGANPPYFQFLKAGKSAEVARDNALACGQELFPKGNAATSLKISARIPQTWMLVLCYFTTFGGFMALTAWFPTFWKKGMGLVPGGKLSDRIGGEKVSMAALALLAVAGVLMNIPMGWGGLFFVSLLISVAFGFNNGATMKLVPVYVSEGVGGANGWVGGFGAFGGFVFPPLMGRLVDLSPEHGYGWGFLLFTFFALLVMVINYFGMMRKKH